MSIEGIEVDPNGSRKEDRILWNDRQVLTQIVKAQSGNVNFVNLKCFFLIEIKCHLDLANYDQ